MDPSVHRSLMRQFTEAVDRGNLKTDFPEQFQKHWENQGQSGLLRIFDVRLINVPCEMRFSLYFSGEEIIQTGIHIRYKDLVIVNEVQRGDVLNYRAEKRIDPVAFLQERFATKKTAEADAAAFTAPQPEESQSFTLTLDDDAEPQVFRAVEQLTGMNKEELRVLWNELLQDNPYRPSLEKISPIIKTWLKKERDRLDMMYLRDVHLLEERHDNIERFEGHGRAYAVVCKTCSGNLIREWIDQTDPEWWGGMFFAIRHGRLCKIPHDQNDRLVALRSFDGAIDFPVEEIFIGDRHIYSVVFIADEAIVWRTRNSVMPVVKGAFGYPGAVQSAENPLEKFLGHFKRKAGVAAEPEADLVLEEVAPEQEGAGANAFFVARAERDYMNALTAKSAELNAKRTDYMTILYDSDTWRFRNKPDDLRVEMEEAAEKALGKDAGGIAREKALITAHATIFIAEKQAPP